MNIKSRIIFVDDEQSILNSIRREVRSEIDDWDMDFYESARDALDSFAGTKPLVVVSDKRMQQMDGIDFLQQVRERSPRSIRVLLTGENTQDVAGEFANLAHMLVAKPYHRNDILNVMSQAKCLDSLPIDDSVREQLGSITQLPVFPKTYTDLRQLLSDEDASIQAVADLVSKEPVVLAKLVQLANSPFLGFVSPASSPLDAVMRLGLDMVSSLVLTMGVFRESHNIDLVFRETLLHESFLVAEICQQIAIQNGDNQESSSKAFLLGMLRSIGYLVPDESVLKLPSQKPESLIRQEDVVGAYILALWGFEKSFVEAVYYQHIPESCPNVSTLMGYLHVASTVVSSRQYEASQEQLLSQLNQSILKELDIWDASEETLQNLA